MLKWVYGRLRGSATKRPIKYNLSLCQQKRKPSHIYAPSAEFSQKCFLSCKTVNALSLADVFVPCLLLNIGELKQRHGTAGSVTSLVVSLDSFSSHQERVRSLPRTPFWLCHC